MDTAKLDAPATAEEMAALDASLGPALDASLGPALGAGPALAVGAPLPADRAVVQARRESLRHLLLPALHALNDRVGWISPGGLAEVCRRLRVAPAEAYGVAGFYDLFSLQPRPATVTYRCTSLACALAGVVPAGVGEHVVDAPCLGQCERAPAALRVTAGDPPRAELDTAHDEVARSVPQVGEAGLVLLRRVGVVDPTDIDAYRAHDGGLGLDVATGLGPGGLREQVAMSGLMGRGGAAFPAWRKWDAVAANPGPRYVVVNADESEPGTFKDRVLLEQDPFAIVEGAACAAYGVGAERIYVYLRGEYTLAHRRLAGAIAAAYRAGWLGADAAGTGMTIDMEIRRGAGAYICGEETALFNSIEGLRGEPRSKPPFPVQVGLFGRPTLVHNVETIANVAAIAAWGGASFSERERKLLCLSGPVVRPGVYEVPFGVTLREVLDLAGGVIGGVAGGAPDGGSSRREPYAVLLGGAAGAFATPDQLDVRLTFDDLRAAGLTLGSGVVMPVRTQAELHTMLDGIAHFFRHESCGQCVPCRVGTVRQQELLARIDQPGARGLLAEVDQVMTDASICGLGQTAAGAIRSAITKGLL